MHGSSVGSTWKSRVTTPPERVTSATTTPSTLASATSARVSRTREGSLSGLVRRSLGRFAPNRLLLPPTPPAPPFPRLRRPCSSPATPPAHGGRSSAASDGGKGGRDILAGACPASADRVGPATEADGIPPVEPVAAPGPGDELDPLPSAAASRRITAGGLRSGDDGSVAKRGDRELTAAVERGRRPRRDEERRDGDGRWTFDPHGAHRPQAAARTRPTNLRKWLQRVQREGPTSGDAHLRSHGRRGRTRILGARAEQIGRTRDAEVRVLDGQRLRLRRGRAGRRKRERSPRVGTAVEHTAGGAVLRARAAPPEERSPAATGLSVIVLDPGRVDTQLSPLCPQSMPFGELDTSPGPETVSSRVLDLTKLTLTCASAPGGMAQIGASPRAPVLPSGEAVALRRRRPEHQAVGGGQGHRAGLIARRRVPTSGDDALAMNAHCDHRRAGAGASHRTVTWRRSTPGQQRARPTRPTAPLSRAGASATGTTRAAT